MSLALKLPFLKGQFYLQVDTQHQWNSKNMQSIEELDHVKEVQSGSNHFDNQSIQVNHSKIWLVKKKALEGSCRARHLKSTSKDNHPECFLIRGRPLQKFKHLGKLSQVHLMERLLQSSFQWRFLQRPQQIRAR